MAEIDVAAYREAVFGNGQTPTQTPTPTPANEPPTNTIVEPTTTVVDAPVSTVTEKEEDEIVDADEYMTLQLKENLGVASWEEAKAIQKEINDLKAKATTPAELKYANEQSKAIHEALQAGKIDEVYDFIDTQKKIAAVEKMSPADAIKLHIQLNNKNFRPIDIQDVFEEKYTYPEKPVQGDTELDNEFASRQEKWQATKEKIDRRIERDSDIAKSDLQKLHAELKLPEIPKPVAEPTSDPEAEAKLQEAEKAAKDFYSKLSPKDIQMVFKFNDEANKLAFDIAYEPDKESFKEAVDTASDIKKFWQHYYDKDGNPDRKKFIQDLFVARNISKIVAESNVQAVNQERLRALKVSKNISDGTQRNYNVAPPSEIDKLREQVFG